MWGGWLDVCVGGCVVVGVVGMNEMRLRYFKGDVRILLYRKCGVCEYQRTYKPLQTCRHLNKRMGTDERERGG